MHLVVKVCATCCKVMHVDPARAGRKRFCSVLCRAKFGSRIGLAKRRANPLGRLRAQLVRVGECDEFVGPRSKKDGYGKFTFDGDQLAHRVAYRLLVGPIPKGLLVCHTCDNPPCCRKEHLFLGTYLDNNRDRERKGRGKRLRGPAHPNATLTARQEAEMTRLLAEGHTPATIAAQLGVGRSAVYKRAGTGRSPWVAPPAMRDFPQLFGMASDVYSVSTADLTRYARMLPLPAREARRAISHVGVYVLNLTARAVAKLMQRDIGSIRHGLRKLSRDGQADPAVLERVEKLSELARAAFRDVTVQPARLRLREPRRAGNPRSGRPQ